MHRPHLQATTTAPTPARASLTVRLIAILLVAAALKLGRPILVPLAGGMFVAALLGPLHATITTHAPQRFKWLGLLTAFTVALLGVSAFFTGLYVSGQTVADEIRERRPQLERQVERLRSRAATSGLEPDATTPRPDAVGKAAGGAALATGAALGQLILVLAFAMLALAEADDARRRLVRLGPAGVRSLAIIDDVAPAFRRYAGVKSITSSITGTFTGLASWALGLPVPWVWGFLAFLFEFMPSIGSILAIAPPVLIALATGGLQKAGVTLLVIGAGQVVLGNFVDPHIEGRLTAISPFTVLLSVVVWGWLWGPAGALLAVPLTVALTLAGRHLHEFTPLAVLFSDEHDTGGGARR